MLTVVVLPAPLGPSTPLHRSDGYGQVDAVDRQGVAEPFHQTSGVDGQFATGWRSVCGGAASMNVVMATTLHVGAVVALAPAYTS